MYPVSGSSGPGEPALRFLGVPAADLCDSLTRLLGFGAAGSQLRDVILQQITHMQQTEQLQERNGRLYAARTENWSESR